ncbi:MAG: hypothetical protein ABII01_04605 [Candidatus Woesearchaeota archaeon]
MEIKETYKGLRKKYDLPDFETLDRDFEASSIEEDRFLLREIRKKIVEKIEFYSKILEDIVQPEATVTSMHECKAFEENEKEQVYAVYMRMMAAHRKSITLSLEDGEPNEAKFIKEFTIAWKDIKPELIKIIKKLEESWKKDTEFKEELGYLG